jgi:hypothetical protein
MVRIIMQKEPIMAKSEGLREVAKTSLRATSLQSKNLVTSWTAQWLNFQMTRLVSNFSAWCMKNVR